MNTPAAAAAIAVFLVVAILFGHPAQAATDQPTGVASTRLPGR